MVNNHQLQLMTRPEGALGCGPAPDSTNRELSKEVAVKGREVVNHQETNRPIHALSPASGCPHLPWSVKAPAVYQRLWRRLNRFCSL